MKAITDQWPWLIVLVIFGALFVSLQRIITQASLTKVSIVGAPKSKKKVAGRELYEKMKEEDVESREAEEAEEVAERLMREAMEQEVSELASTNPEAVAKIVKGWLAED